MDAETTEMVLRLFAALAAGGAIGYERSYHGRPAGFRTHALVCTASSLLMLVTVYESHWMPDTDSVVQIDPTRMAQGIMTGIGFLGAGVIIKEGLSVRGLTTAASIWITSAIGVLAGIGFYLPLVVSVLIVVGVLSVFRRIEARMPMLSYYQLDVRYAPSAGISEDELRALINAHGFTADKMSYRLDEGRVRRRRTVIRTSDAKSARRLAETLEKDDAILEFRIAPAGD